MLGAACNEDEGDGSGVRFEVLEKPSEDVVKCETQPPWTHALMAVDWLVFSRLSIVNFSIIRFESLLVNTPSPAKWIRHFMAQS